MMLKNDDANWHDPEPIQQTLLPVLPFPKENIPFAYLNWICDIAERMQCQGESNADNRT